MFKKVLVANRGEIACRVIRTCKELGVDTVAIYSDADASALHVEMADEAVRVGEAPVAASYLNAAAIIGAAVATGAEAIHPGYGLLSENPGFAASCDERGIVFVGPPREAMQAVAHKIPARERATAAGLAVVPGDDRPVTADTVLERCRDVGFPLMLKASAGGGGIGMVLARDEEGLERRFKQAQSLAERAFGSGDVYVERYLPNARHVEVQVLADHHGNCVHLYTRDCSVQRRHQKVVEEAPAPNLAAGVSEALVAAAVRLAREIGYTNAGTVEFLVSGSDFYFLEMNARLQVEHPVTELVTGIDLVSEQLRIASDEPLIGDEGRYTLEGHAIECRIYAEDPVSYRPSPGRIEKLDIPAGEGVRLDTGFRSGDEITTFYDPMIAKLAVWGPDRGTAVSRLLDVLANSVVTGIKTNLPMLNMVVASEAFQAGRYNTGIVAELSSVNGAATPGT